MRVTEAGTTGRRKQTTLRLDTALERYAVRTALRHDAAELRVRIAEIRPGRLQRLYEARLKACEALYQAMAEVTAEELEAEAMTDYNPRGGI